MGLKLLRNLLLILAVGATVISSGWAADSNSTTASTVATTANRTSATKKTTNGTPSPNSTIASTIVTATNHTPIVVTTYGTPSTNGTTASSTSGEITGQPTTTAADNTTNNGTTVYPVKPIVPTFQWLGYNGICILASIDVELQIDYETENGEKKVAHIPVTRDARIMGLCRTNRTFSISQLDDTSYVIFTFNKTTTTGYTLSKIEVEWHYTKHFSSDAKLYGTTGNFQIFLVTHGTVGKTLKCAHRTYINSLQPDFTNDGWIKMKNMMLQPYADFANPKGTFGEVEDCDAPHTQPTPTLTYQPMTTGSTTAAPSSSVSVGVIVGIAIGALALVAVVIGVAVYVIRKRGPREVAYENVEQI